MSALVAAVLALGVPAPAAAPPRVRCPAGVARCRAATGRIVYVERVDPDGDGDLHVVVAAGSISLPGLTSIDVSRDLRPPVDPRPGQRAGGAGPVLRGSFGQRQIQAVRFRVVGDQRPAGRAAAPRRHGNRGAAPLPGASPARRTPPERG